MAHSAFQSRSCGTARCIILPEIPPPRSGDTGRRAPRRADQAPVSAAISARERRPRSVADFNCPQAAMMSSPRGVRIGLA